MNILVCVKQVPDMEGHFVPNGSGSWFDEAGHAWRMNEYDGCAVEEAVRLKEIVGGDASVSVLSIGPARVVETIRKALAMGCDHGVHIDDPEAAERDPWQIATMIAGFAGGRNFDVIFTGMQSEDRSSAQVGVLVAERLGYACVTGIVAFEWRPDHIMVERELEAGRRCSVKLSAPAVLTCQLGLNTPRYPALPGIMRSKRAALTVMQPGEFAVDAPKVSSGGFRHHERKSSGLILEGDVSTLAAEVVSILQTKTTLPGLGGVR